MRRTLFLALTGLFLLASPTWAAEELEVLFPPGVDSPPKTMKVSVAAPCVLVIRVAVDPFYGRMNNAPLRWGNSTNTIPPFPIGQGISESRAWENGSPVEWLHVKDGSRVFLEYRFRIERGTHQGTMLVIPPQERNLAGAFMNQYKQHVRVTVETRPLDTDTPWGPGPNRPVPTVTDETSWNVGHPVAWVFHSNGTVEAPGLWSGTWTKNGDDYVVQLTHQGATDRFTVRFSPDGRSFTAYKDGQVYRTGVRVR
ncbi:MAG: hypothetical protein AB1758_00845 [Candidatus Eremiobacterota bacterium]